MNIETAHAIRDRIRQSPKEIRVLCPRGHFIAHILLHVADEGNTDPPIWMHPRGPRKQYVSNMTEGSHGFQMDLHRPTFSVNVRLVCSRCAYAGSFVHDRLAVELAAAAIAGHAEYRLTA